MKTIINILLITFLFILTSANAYIVNFTGGEITFGEGYSSPNGDSKAFTNNDFSYSGVKSYTEDNFYMEYVVTDPEHYGHQTVGNYYGDGDVIHGHWGEFIWNPETGQGEYDYSVGLTSIEITTLDGSAFDLQYLSLTSNTEQGGGPATGNEKIDIQGFLNGEAVTSLYRIPSEDWGGTYQDVIFGDEFNNVDRITISGEGAFCYGMDNFVFDEAIPQSIFSGNTAELEKSPEIPEPSSYALIAGFLALTYIALRRR